LTVVPEDSATVIDVLGHWATLTVVVEDSVTLIDELGDSVVGSPSLVANFISFLTFQYALKYL